MEASKKRSSPIAFFRDVRAEMRKVTWATRKETTYAGIMVLIMVVAAAIFFTLADGIISAAVRLVLGIGGH